MGGLGALAPEEVAGTSPPLLGHTAVASTAYGPFFPFSRTAWDVQLLALGPCALPLADPLMCLTGRSDGFAVWANGARPRCVDSGSQGPVSRGRSVPWGPTVHRFCLVNRRDAGWNRADRRSPDINVIDDSPLWLPLSNLPVFSASLNFGVNTLQ